MADHTPPRQMSLIPWNDNREVVLRRGNAVVVYDAQSHQLTVRDTSDDALEITECPYCHRPLRDDHPATNDDEPRRRFSHGLGSEDRSFVDPDYFDMLAASRQASPGSSGPGTPTAARRLVHPALRSGRSREVSSDSSPPSDAEFVASEPRPTAGQGISSSAFSQGYFKQFFREERELGRGGNGVVLLVEHVMDGVPLGHFACKRIPVGNDHSWLEKVLVEVKLLQNLPHKNLVSYHWVWLEDHKPSMFGPSVPCLWILQEYCNGGDLHAYVLGPAAKEAAAPSIAERLKQRARRRSKGDPSPPDRDLRGPSKLTFEDIFSFFRDLTSGLHHLHSKGYIHRDLKPSNCLLQHDGAKTKVLLSDFGEVQKSGAKRGNTGATGTISYCAPEVVRKETLDGSYGDFTTKSDIFSLGMIVYFMCFGRLPYSNADDINEENEDLEQLRAEITAWPGFDDETRTRPDLPEKLYRYLKRLLSVNPDQRPSTEEILASIKGNATLSEIAPSMLDDVGPRVSSIDSPARRPTPQPRRASTFVSRPGLSSLSRHQSGERLHRSPSPVKRPLTADQSRSHSRPTSPVDSSVVVRPRKIDLPPPGSAAPAAQQSPRLMLPPPPPDQPRMTAFVRLIRHPSTVLALRGSLFMLKLLSLSLPCSPYATSPWFMYSLLGVAALDLGIVSWNLRQSMLLFGLHFAVVLIAKQHAMLCEGRAMVWESAGFGFL